MRDDLERTDLERGDLGPAGDRRTTAPSRTSRLERAEDTSGVATGVLDAPRRKWAARVRTLARVVVWSGFGYLFAVALLIVAYRFVDPPLSTLMLGQKLVGERVIQVWRPLRDISPALVRAVIASEDGQFCRHRGVDWRELEAVVKNFGDGGGRGGSTISMQVTKNLFLWPGRSYLRKALEIPLTLVLEFVWPKQRVLEVYLNIAEWGPGVFGAEAASQFHFERTARQIDEREAALLAVSLPNPFDRDAGDPGVGTQRLADRLQNRLKQLPSQANCVLGGRVGSLQRPDLRPRA
jgi:monofunctional glycosyltransferase